MRSKVFGTRRCNGSARGRGGQQCRCADERTATRHSDLRVQRIFDINLMSVVRSNAVFLPLLLDQGSGHLVNTGSFAGLFTYSYDRQPYAATKAASCRSARPGDLLAAKGIGVTLLCRDRC